MKEQQQDQNFKDVEAREAWARAFKNVNENDVFIYLVLWVFVIVHDSHVPK